MRGGLRPAEQFLGRRQHHPGALADREPIGGQRPHPVHRRVVVQRQYGIQAAPQYGPGHQRRRAAVQPGHHRLVRAGHDHPLARRQRRHHAGRVDRLDPDDPGLRAGPGPEVPDHRGAERPDAELHQHQIRPGLTGRGELVLDLATGSSRSRPSPPTGPARSPATRCPTRAPCPARGPPPRTTGPPRRSCRAPGPPRHPRRRSSRSGRHSDRPARRSGRAAPSRFATLASARPWLPSVAASNVRSGSRPARPARPSLADQSAGRCRRSASTVAQEAPMILNDGSPNRSVSSFTVDAAGTERGGEFRPPAQRRRGIAGHRPVQRQRVPAGRLDPRRPGVGVQGPRHAEVSSAGSAASSATSSVSSTQSSCCQLTVTSSPGRTPVGRSAGSRTSTVRSPASTSILRAAPR